MNTPASVLRHPIHPMLVPLPIGLWIFSLVCDLVYAFGWGGPLWSDMAFYSMIGGIVGALAAAAPGYVDYRSVSHPRLVRIGRFHMLINLSLVLLYAVNAWLRTAGLPGAVLPLVLSCLGIGLLGVAGWLGGELVYVHGVAVEAAGAEPGEAKQRRRAAS